MDKKVSPEVLENCKRFAEQAKKRQQIYIQEKTLEDAWNRRAGYLDELDEMEEDYEYDE